MLNVLRSWFRDPTYVEAVRKSPLAAAILLGVLLVLAAIGR